MTLRSFENELMFCCWVIEKMKWKVECQAKVRNSMSNQVKYFSGKFIIISGGGYKKLYI